MNTRTTAPDPGIIEWQYRYQYRWSAVISVALIGGALAAGTIWLALFERRPWILAAAAPLVAMFVLGGRAALINVQGSHRLIVARDGLYVPSFWSDRSYTRILYQAITRVETINRRTGPLPPREIDDLD
jgi:hypothetical protein